MLDYFHFFLHNLETKKNSTTYAIHFLQNIKVYLILAHNTETGGVCRYVLIYYTTENYLQFISLTNSLCLYCTYLLFYYNILFCSYVCYYNHLQYFFINVKNIYLTSAYFVHKQHFTCKHKGMHNFIVVIRSKHTHSFNYYVVHSKFKVNESIWLFDNYND